MSQRYSGYERKERDLYETPEWVTEVFCQHLYRRSWMLGHVWEPAAGSGKMLDVLSRYADPGCAWGTDIEPMRADIEKVDFLATSRIHTPTGYCGAIVTNPPYDLAQQFIEHSLRLCEGRSVGKIAMLLRTDYDHAKSRSHLFRDCSAFEKKIVLQKRICWFVEANGKPKASPSFNHAWYIWDWKHVGPPTIGYGP